MGFFFSVVGVESLPNHLLTHTNAQHATTAAGFFEKPTKAIGFGNSIQHLREPERTILQVIKLYEC